VAIIEAGLVLQLDDPAIAENWDQINPAPSVADYRRFTRKRVEALNFAIRGLPAERIRFHLCWGSWHGPHTTDFPMADLVDIMLEINAGAYSFEAANVRHEHEWKIWRDVKLPQGKVILPGVVSHSTNVIEHPEVVADRITRFAEAVGRENVIASTDCGLGGRVHPQIAWAKLDTLVKGAELATAQLWGELRRPAACRKFPSAVSRGGPFARLQGAPIGRARQAIKARKGRSMSTEQNKAVVGRWFTEFWGKDFNPGVIDELAAPNIRFEYSLHAPLRGRGAVREFAEKFRAAFPDLNFWGTADLIAEGDYVVGQWEGGGTHTGPAFSDFLVGSLPAATGHKMHPTRNTVLKVVGGKIVQEIGLDDGLTAMTQLELITKA